MSIILISFDFLLKFVDDTMNINPEAIHDEIRLERVFYKRHRLTTQTEPYVKKIAIWTLDVSLVLKFIYE